MTWCVLSKTPSKRKWSKAMLQMLHYQESRWEKLQHKTSHLDTCILIWLQLGKSSGVNETLTWILYKQWHHIHCCALGCCLGFIVRRMMCVGIGMILAPCRKPSPTVTADCTMNCQHMKPCNPSKQLGRSFSGVERPVLNKIGSQDTGIPDLQKAVTEGGKTEG